MYEAYSRIFTAPACDFRAVRADSGAIGGSQSHEFHVLADSGEDAIAFSTASDYAANVELAEAVPPAPPAPAPSPRRWRRWTRPASTIDELAPSFGARRAQCREDAGGRGPRTPVVVALVLRGDHELNAVKAALAAVASPLRFASDEEIRARSARARLARAGGPAIPVHRRPCRGGPGRLRVRREPGRTSTWFGVNWGRDLPEPPVADLRNVVEGDPSPDGEGTHPPSPAASRWATSSSSAPSTAQAMNAVRAGRGRQAHVMTMGCYGIGVSRIVAAAIEQNHDDNGISGPPIAPFQVALLPMNAAKS
jgi:prolyl-tRNA synthetase